MLIRFLRIRLQLLGLIFRGLPRNLLKEPHQKHCMRLAATINMCIQPHGPRPLNDITFFQYESYHFCQLLLLNNTQPILLPSLPCDIIHSTWEEIPGSGSSSMTRPSSMLVSRAGRVMATKEVLSLRVMSVTLSLDTAEMISW